MSLQCSSHLALHRLMWLLRQAQSPASELCSSPSWQVLVPNKQGYTFAREGWLSKHVLPERVDLQTNTVLTIEESSGRIARHSDTWEGKPTPPRWAPAHSCF